MNGIRQDLRVALRQLSQRRAFATIVIATLALGIGATTTFFSILNGIALRPLPFRNAERLVAVDRTARGGANRSRISVEQFADVTESAAIAGAIAYATRSVTLSGGDGGAAQAIGAEVSGDPFALLGVPLQRGRAMAPHDVLPVAVISHDLWARRYGISAAALGATISIDGTAHTIVGVAPPGFGFPADARVWFPLSRRAQQRVDVVARLGDGVPLAEASASFAVISAALPDDPSGAPLWTIAAAPLRDAILGSKQRDAAIVLLVASGLVLIVACANLAGLLLAYVSGRRHELAVRAAIGATRGRLVRQLLTESMLLAAAGGALGVLIAGWGVDVFLATLGKPGGANWLTFEMDARVVLFAFAAAGVTVLVFGVAPAVGGSRVDIRGVLQEDRPSSAPRRNRARGILVSTQVALSLGLVTGGASVVLSSLAMGEVYPGFDRDGLVVLRAPLPGARYDAAPQRMAYVDDVRARLRAVPGVAAVSAVSHAPLVDRNVPATSFIVQGWTPTEALPSATFRFVDADYLDVMRIPIRAGRAFTPSEARDEGGRSIVINETMARRHWPGQDAVGARLRLPGAGDPTAWFTVIGVVGDVAQRMLPSRPESQMYFPLPIGRDVAFVVRAAGDPAVVAAAAREGASGVDSSVAVAAFGMDGTYRAYAQDRRLQGLVLAALGAVALLVAALGVFGVMSLTVAERSREIGIRAALGGTPRAIGRLILASTMRLLSAGIAAGLLLAAAVTAFLSSIFYGLRAFDPLVFAGAAALLAGVALAASWWPARTAARVDPMVALRN